LASYAVIVSRVLMSETSCKCRGCGSGATHNAFVGVLGGNGIAAALGESQRAAACLEGCCPRRRCRQCREAGSERRALQLPGALAQGVAQHYEVLEGIDGPERRMAVIQADGSVQKTASVK
jgi:hypothetical protein